MLSGGGGANKNAVATPFAPPSQEVFNKWFPAFKLGKTVTPNPRLRVLCFPSAGNAEDMFTNEGVGARKTPNPLLDWCRENGATVLAVQYPGRYARLTEQQYSKGQELAQAILEVVGSRLQDGVPYVIVTHSMGSWVAYEVMCMARAAGIPLPLHVFVACMPAPDIPLEKRPWRRGCLLSEEEFKEECRGWDINEIVFSPVMWEVYYPLLQADFNLFDGYVLGPTLPEPLPVPITAFWGTTDKRVTEEMVQGWQRFTSREFHGCAVEGNHLFPLHAEDKKPWVKEILAELGQIMQSLGSKEDSWEVAY